MTERDRPEGLEDYVTRRLLEFYDGLLERGQIAPPRAAIRCTEASAPSPGRPQFEAECSHSIPEG